MNISLWNPSPLPIALTLAAVMLALPVLALGEEEPKVRLDLRYRYELVDQDSFAKNAQASTLRTRLAYQSMEYSDFVFAIEIDDVRTIGNDAYNSTRNGNFDRPVVADPEGTNVNQALILHRGIQDTVIRAGRQRITLDNQRFIGDVGWRQNTQTFDGLSLTNTSLPKTTVVYAYIADVNRIFGPDSGTPSAEFESDTHVFNVRHEWTPELNVTAYAYLLDFDDSPLSSNKTTGLRVNGNHAVSARVSTSYVLEYARQENYGDNPNDYSVNYILLQGALTMSGVTGKLGYELLGGNSVQAFQTPLATLHAFQGWSDKFLTTPIAGIEDLYFSIATKIGDADAALIYHRFDPETGGPRYGSEWDIVIKKPLTERYWITVKYSDYDARSVSTDTRKLWLMLTASLGN